MEHYVPVAAGTVSFFDYLDPAEWTLALIEPDQITTNVTKFESLLRNEYEAAAEKGRAVYPPEKLTTAGPEVLAFLGSAKIAFSEVHVGAPPVRPDAAPAASVAPAASPALRGSEFEELRLRAPQVDRYTNRLPEFTNDVKRGHASGRRQVFFAATKGGREKVERLLKEFDVVFVDDTGEAAGATQISAQLRNKSELQSEIVLAAGALPRGFDFEELNLTIYSEWDLFEPPDLDAHRREEAHNRGVRHGSARPESRRLHRPCRPRRRAVPWIAAHSVRPHRARGDGDRVLRRRQAADADGEPQSHPEILRRRGHAAETRQARRHGVGANESLGQESHARHGRRAAQALRHTADGAGPRLLQRLAVAVRVRGRLRVRRDRGSGIGHRRRQVRHGIAQADGSPAVRRRRIRQDRSGHARGVQSGHGRQAGRRPRAHHHPHLPALPHVSAALRLVSRSPSSC